MIGRNGTKKTCTVFLILGVSSPDFVRHYIKKICLCLLLFLPSHLQPSSKPSAISAVAFTTDYLSFNQPPPTYQAARHIDTDIMHDHPIENGRHVENYTISNISEMHSGEILLRKLTTMDTSKPAGAFAYRVLPIIPHAVYDTFHHIRP